ncbi:MAG: hypothetical protein R3Y32_08745 [Bacillota bacterium]
MKKSLSLSFLFIGTVVGAGFSSGREILTFFSASSGLAPLAVVACGVVFFLACFLLLTIASRVDIYDISSLCSYLPTKIRTAFESILIFFFVIICAMMISGADSLFGAGGGIGISGILLFILGSGVAIFGISGLLKVNFVLVPILLTFIVFISCFHLYRSGVPSFDFTNPNYLTSIFEGVSYSSMNLLLSAVVLLSAGKGLKRREILISSALSAVIISTVIMLFFLAMNTSSEFLLADMPIIPMTRYISPLFRWTSLACIWIAIFTTFSSSFLTCFEYFKRFCKSAPLRILILLAITYPISRFGFSQIVTIFMPAMGLFGIILLFFCLRIWRGTKPKKKYTAHKNFDVGVTPLD